MKVYNRNNKPKPSNDSMTLSVDVIAYTEEGLLNIACFDFEEDKWIWHTDTLIDMEELIEGQPMPFNWIYPPAELTRFN